MLFKYTVSAEKHTYMTAYIFCGVYLYNICISRNYIYKHQQFICDGVFFINIKNKSKFVCCQIICYEN